MLNFVSHLFRYRNFYRLYRWKARRFVDIKIEVVFKTVEISWRNDNLKMNDFSRMTEGKHKKSDTCDSVIATVLVKAT